MAATLTAASLDAAASVSVPVTFEDLVRRAIAAAVVMPIDRHAGWENGRIATYTHLRVERLVAGALPGDVWARTEGGAVGSIGQLVEGEATFPKGVESLVFLREHTEPVGAGTFGVVEGAQGQFPIETHDGAPPTLGVPASMAGLVPPPSAAPLARDTLAHHSIEDAARAIATLWPRFHPPSPRTP
jgi:hypothetical protein